MNIKRTAIASAIAATLVSGVGFGATAAYASPATTATAMTASSAADIPVTIDPVAAGDAIAQAVKTADNREGFVKDLMYNAYYNAGQQNYNVVVMNLSDDHDALGLGNVAGYYDATYDGVVYGIWYFQDGTFVKKGDGGWINWAYMGLVSSRTDDGDTATVNFVAH